MLYKTSLVCPLIVLSSLLSACGGGSSGSSTTNPQTPGSTPPPPTNNITFTAQERDYIHSLSLFVPDFTMFTVQQSLLALETGPQAIIDDDEQQCIGNIDVSGDPAQPTEIVIDYETCTLEEGFTIIDGLIRIQNNLGDDTQIVEFSGDMTLDGSRIGFDSQFNVAFTSQNDTETLSISDSAVSINVENLVETISDLNIVKTVDLDSKNYSFQSDMRVESSVLEGSYHCSSTSLTGKLARMPADYALDCSSGSRTAMINNGEYANEVVNADFNFASFPFEFGDLDVSEYAFAFEEFALDNNLSFRNPKFIPQHNAIIANNFANFVYYDWKQNTSVELEVPSQGENAMAVLDNEVALIASRNAVVTYSRFPVTNPAQAETVAINLRDTLNIENDTAGRVDEINEFGSYFLLAYRVMSGSGSSLESVNHILVLIEKATGELASVTPLQDHFSDFIVVNQQTVLARHVSNISSPYSVYNLNAESFEQAEDIQLDYTLSCLLDYRDDAKIGLFGNNLINVNTATLALNSESPSLSFSFDCEDITISHEYAEIAVINDSSTFRQADFYWYDANSLEFLSRSGQTFRSTFLDVNVNDTYEIKHAYKDFYILIAPGLNSMVITGRFSDSTFAD